MNRCSRTATVCFHLNGKKRSSLMKLASQENQARKGDVLSFLWPKLCLHHCGTRSRVEGTTDVRSLRVRPGAALAITEPCGLPREKHTAPRLTPRSDAGFLLLRTTGRLDRTAACDAGGTPAASPASVLDATALTSPWSSPEMSPDIATT